MRSSGGPGSVSAGTQASSGKSGTVSADARVPCESAKCSSETDRGSIVQELCESRGGRPGLSVLTSLLVSVDVKIY